MNTTWTDALHTGFSKKALRKLALSASSALALAACGGDGGGDEQAPPPAPPGNVAPVFAGNFNAAIEENTTNGFVANIEVSDGNDNAITLSLGGPDAALFDINADAIFVANGVTFDFEAPADANGDNVYEIIISANDGFVTTNQAFTTEITNIVDTALEERGAILLIGEQASVDEATAILSVGDLDGDTKDELVINAPFFEIDPNAIAEEGIVTLLRGGFLATAQEAIVSLADLDAPDLVRMEGFAGADGGALEPGFAFATLPSLDNDALPELVVTGLGGGLARAFTFIVTGATMADAFTNGGVIELEEVGNGGAEGGALLTADAVANSGFGEVATALRDLSGDGTSELVVCASFADANGFQNNGRAFVVFGEELQDTVLGNERLDVDSTNSLINGDIVLIEGNGDFDVACDRAVSAGDVDNDGLDDLLITTREIILRQPGQDREIFLILGQAIRDALGANKRIQLSDAVQQGQAVKITPEVIDGGGSFAMTAMGDVNGDDVDDFLIGDEKAGNETGAAYLIFGDPNIARLAPNRELALAAVGEEVLPGIKFTGAQFEDLTGQSVAAIDDLDGDGFSEVLISAEDVSGVTDKAFLISSTEFQGGAAQIDLVDFTILRAENGALVRSPLQSALEIVNIPERVTGGVPLVVSAGDVDGDGRGDIAIGGENDNDIGQVFIVSGRLASENLGAKGVIDMFTVFPELTN